MSDNYMPVQSVTADYKLDTESLTVGSNTVQRERVELAGASALEIAAVKAATPSSGLYGLVCRILGLADSGGTDMTDTTNHALKVSNVTGIQLTSVLPDSVGTLARVGGQITSATTTSVVSAVAAKQTKIYGMILYNGGTANNITIQDGTPTNLVGTSAVFNLAANQGMILDLRGDKWFNACATNTVLQIVTSSAGPLTYDIYYTNN